MSLSTGWLHSVVRPTAEYGKITGGPSKVMSAIEKQKYKGNRSQRCVSRGAGELQKEEADEETSDDEDEEVEGPEGAVSVTAAHSPPESALTARADKSTTRDATSFPLCSAAPIRVASSPSNPTVKNKRHGPRSHNKDVTTEPVGKKRRF